MQRNWVVPQREQHPLHSEKGLELSAGKMVRESPIGCIEPKEIKAR